MPPHLKAQIIRELDRLELLPDHIAIVERECDLLVSAADENTTITRPAATLCAIKGSRRRDAAVLWTEGLSRQFDNRRRVAAYLGLAPTPWQSGTIDREQGVSKAGNPRLRTTMIQLAWLWLRNQPSSALSKWFFHRVQSNGGHYKKSTIVALTRNLLVVLWKFVRFGVVSTGSDEAGIGNARMGNLEIFQG